MEGNGDVRELSSFPLPKPRLHLPVLGLNDDGLDTLSNSESTSKKKKKSTISRLKHLKRDSLPSGGAEEGPFKQPITVRGSQSSLRDSHWFAN